MNKSIPFLLILILAGATVWAQEAEKRPKRQVPQERYGILGKGSTGHLSYAASEQNRRPDDTK